MSVFDEQNMIIRDSVEDDIPFIFATWLRGLYHGNTWFKQIPDALYFETYHRILEKVLERPTTSIKVACFKDEPNVITGYAVYTNTTLHWVFVKTGWRRVGIAKRLVPASITQTTHLTSLGQNIKPSDWIFNPFAL